ncbi:TraY domain-containing protein [Salmonella enterica subsp. enterica serovar Newport]|nr:TraY domain-containing protein [Salmonella enterica]EBO9763026.1 TraY domain-containing protein [Salmonella enterica]EHC9819242.1 TraY domain-containing protein [Salmonella enterica subsp. enterica serovar Newport]
MKRYGSRAALGRVIKLSLPSFVNNLLTLARERSGRSKSFEAALRLKDHLDRFPEFQRVTSFPEMTEIVKVTIRLNDETNKKLIAAKNRSGWNKTYEAAARLRDHLKRYPDFYNAEIFREVIEETESKFKEI